LDQQSCSVKILHLSNPADAAFFQSLRRDEPRLQVFDEIAGQLRELVKSLQPQRKMSKADVEEAVVAHLNGVAPADYGVWVFYPWSCRLVHLLDEEEFVFLRTNRNCNKITLEERAILSRKRVGIIGLSVGQSVAVTLAMERSFGELRLADFDLLELTNLNRIRTGVHNLNVSKAVMVAREIAEIDPFLKTVCFVDGITEQNLDAFFFDGGKLDVVIDECDGLDVKVLCRRKAKALGVPVLMEASDRGMIDVERFDLEPERPLLHGFLAGLDVEKLAHLRTNEEKVPYMLAFLGLGTVSARLKASMLEIEQTVSTWPQLASAVVLGGALTADVYRRIMLDQFHASGRYFIDLEELVCDAPRASPEIQAAAGSPVLPEPPPALDLGPYLEAHAEAEALTLSCATIERLVAAAAAAPSGANFQPWLWVQKGSALALLHDDSRSQGYTLFRNTSDYLGLGAALENLVLEAHALALEVRIETWPEGLPEKVVAVLRFFAAGAARPGLEPHIADDLAPAIAARGTNRRIVPRTPIAAGHLEALTSLAEQTAGARLLWATGEDELGALSDLVATSDRLRFLHPDAHKDFFEREVKWTREESERDRFGIDIAGIDLTPTEHVGFLAARDPRVVAYLREWGGGKGFEKLSRKTVASASAVGLLTLPRFERETFLLGGRTMERVWLAATQRGLALQPMTALLVHIARLQHGRGEGIPEAMQSEMAPLRRGLFDLFGLRDEREDPDEPVFLFRLLVAEPMATASLRLPLSEVLRVAD